MDKELYLEKRRFYSLQELRVLCMSFSATEKKLKDRTEGVRAECSNFPFAGKLVNTRLEKDGANCVIYTVTEGVYSCCCHRELNEQEKSN